MLRDYQQKQLAFLKQSHGITRALESPTGSGKSVVLFEYIKQYIDEINILNETKTIVLSTGFNELVFQLYEDAKMYGLDPIVIIGKNHLYSSNNQNGFIYKKEMNLSPDDSSYMLVREFLNSNKTKFIITNHAFLLSSHLKSDLLIIDEAHTFKDFYDLNTKFELPEDISKIFLNYISDAKYPISKIVKLYIENNQYLPENIRKPFAKEFSIISKCDESWFLYQLNNFYKNHKVKWDLNHYSYIEDNKFTIQTYYTYFDLNCSDVIITSATLDDYTLKMFNVNKTRVFKQKAPEDRYKNSFFIEVKNDFLKSQDILESILETSNFKSGLILCTTINMVNSINNKKSINGFQIFTDLNNFLLYPDKKILVGSKKYFQGINIPDLDFVILDKIPFDKYNNEQKSQLNFIKNILKKNTWFEFTIPLVENTINQASGRLWRKNNFETGEYDDGTFIIFDKRLSKFSFIEKYIQYIRPGINIQKY